MFARESESLIECIRAGDIDAENDEQCRVHSEHFDHLQRTTFGLYFCSIRFGSHRGYWDTETENGPSLEDIIIVCKELNIPPSEFKICATLGIEGENEENTQRFSN